MSLNRWTELFFHDEATAFSAGHRPCFECRKDDAVRFKKYWNEGNPEYAFDMRTSIKYIDSIVHRERIDDRGEKVTHQRLFSDIPGGTFIAMAGEAYLVHDRFIHHWTPFGYEEGKLIEDDCLMTILTPRSFVNAFIAGYKPVVKL